MQANYILFFYLLSFLLWIPILVLGSLLKPSTKKKILKTSPTPKQILEQIKKDKEQTHRALQDFEQFFLNAESCEKSLWLEMIKDFALSLNLEVTEITALQEKLKTANPTLNNEIALTISTALKNRK